MISRTLHPSLGGVWDVTYRQEMRENRSSDGSRGRRLISISGMAFSIGTGGNHMPLFRLFPQGCRFAQAHRCERRGGGDYDRRVSKQADPHIPLVLWEMVVTEPRPEGSGGHDPSSPETLCYDVYNLHPGASIRSSRQHLARWLKMPCGDRNGKKLTENFSWISPPAR